MKLAPPPKFHQPHFEQVRLVAPQFNGQLTENFALSEFTRSDTARRLGIDNRPPEDALFALWDLAEFVLQPARNALDIPLRVTSGYRAPALNTAIGGSKTSDHMFGRAADIETVPETEDRMWALGLHIETRLQFKQLIWEFGGEWIHVSYHTGHNRCEVLEAYVDPVSRRTRYRPFTFQQQAA